MDRVGEAYHLAQRAVADLKGAILMLLRDLDSGKDLQTPRLVADWESTGAMFDTQGTSREPCLRGWNRTKSWFKMRLPNAGEPAELRGGLVSSRSASVNLTCPSRGTARPHTALRRPARGRRSESAETPWNLFGGIGNGFASQCASAPPL